MNYKIGPHSPDGWGVSLPFVIQEYANQAASVPTLAPLYTRAARQAALCHDAFVIMRGGTTQKGAMQLLYIANRAAKNTIRINRIIDRLRKVSDV